MGEQSNSELGYVVAGADGGGGGSMRCWWGSMVGVGVGGGGVGRGRREGDRLRNRMM